MEPLNLGSDLALRYRYFTRASLAHPAKLHLGLLVHLIERYTAPGDTIADPMAGIGSVAYAALLQRNVILREIEPRWLALAHENAAQIIRAAGMFAGSINIAQADAREPWGFKADHIIFSPPYGCAVAPTATSKGMSSHQIRARLDRLGTYDKAWDRLIRAYDNGAAGVVAAYTMHYGSHPAQIGPLRGKRYWSEMMQVYSQAAQALPIGGTMILIIKDHIKNGKRVHIADETAERCQALGFSLAERLARHVYPLSLWQRRRKERGEPVIEEEDVLVFERRTAKR